MNTFFDKPDYKKCTYAEPGTEINSPRERPFYEVLDYILIESRWKNGINKESDIYAKHLPRTFPTDR